MIPRLFRWRDRVAGLAGKHPFLLSLIVMLLIVIPGLVRLQNITDDQSQSGKCISSWADQYTERAERITKVNAVTSAATGAYIHSLTVVLGDAIAQDQTALKRDLVTYQKAAVDYEAAAKVSRDALARDPIPPAPKFQCR